MMVVYEVQLIPAGFPKQGKQRQRVVKRLEKDQADFKCLGFGVFFPPKYSSAKSYTDQRVCNYTETLSSMHTCTRTHTLAFC